MCGIAGLISLKRETISSSILEKMLSTMTHRGPDGNGIWRHGAIGFAHTRLSIIDLSESASQPMVSKDGRYVLVFNGELYNYLELKKHLIGKGFQFQTTSDTEVLLNSLIYWGVDAISKFNGMFAFGFWDNVTETLILARDRYGIKPLYYVNQTGFFSFASEQKTILATNLFEKKMNHGALLEYFTFQNIFSDSTLLEGFRILPAGSYGVFSIRDQGPNLSIYKYWDFNFSEPANPRDTHEYEEELVRLFRQAVNRQLVCDVQIGSYLSGGIDSTSIASVASQFRKPIKTFTIGFNTLEVHQNELHFDESHQARESAKFMGSEHFEYILQPNDLENCMRELSWHIEEPRVGQSYPNYYAARLASRHVKVVLSGIGGDELFGGYPWRYFRYSGKLEFDHYIDAYYLYWQRLIDNSTIKLLFRPSQSNVEGVWTRDIFKNVFNNYQSTFEKPEDYINSSLYFEAKTFLHGLFLVEDKLSMAHGLETRVPFMDNDLVNFAMQCPASLKVQNFKEVFRVNENEYQDKKRKYFEKTRDGKRILRGAMRDIVSTQIQDGSKQGFSAPDTNWFRTEGTNFVNSKLADKNAAIFDYLDYNTVQHLLRRHFDGKENLRLLIWSLISVESWIGHYL